MRASGRERAATQARRHHRSQRAQRSADDRMARSSAEPAAGGPLGRRVQRLGAPPGRVAACPRARSPGMRADANGNDDHLLCRLSNNISPRPARVRRLLSVISHYSLRPRHPIVDLRGSTRCKVSRHVPGSAVLALEVVMRRLVVQFVTTAFMLSLLGVGSASAVDFTLPSLWQSYQDYFTMGTFGNWNSPQALYHYRSNAIPNNLKLDSQVGTSSTNSLSRQAYVAAVAQINADPTLDAAAEGGRHRGGQPADRPAVDDGPDPGRGHPAGDRGVQRGQPPDGRPEEDRARARVRVARRPAAQLVLLQRLHLQRGQPGLGQSRRRCSSGSTTTSTR